MYVDIKKYIALSTYIQKTSESDTFGTVSVLFDTLSIYGAAS